VCAKLVLVKVHISYRHSKAALIGSYIHHAKVADICDKCKHLLYSLLYNYGDVITTPP